jgi:hypothetical protein
MNLFRKRTASTPDAPGERRCRACSGALADDQHACLECGAVDAPVGGRDRRWMLPTGGLAGGALFLVTSASFAATTALNTGDPATIKKQPPAVAQAPALPPASGDGTVPNSAQEDSGKGPDLSDLPAGGSGGGGGAAPPAADSGGSGDSGNSDSGNSDGGNSDSGNADSGNSNSGSGSGSTPTPKPKPKPKPEVKVAEWPDGFEGYTVVVYKFDDKAGAKAKAKEVAGKGLPAGIVDSDKYKSLDPGSWLVFIGQFDSSKQADKAGQKYENAGYPGEVTFVGQTETPESDSSGSSGTGSSAP